ncbi:calcium-dependent protein kinase 24 [Capsicum annuum]|uniref:calcium-dependent protein kinase 24 n=1 Tax=Capsicum annuum TaxID=4072 RepID=UPI001FB19489|nr:calcium-dependent protein kinase 24 [Capsicum annuum]
MTNEGETHSGIYWHNENVVPRKGYQVIDNPLWYDETLFKDEILFLEDGSTSIGMDGIQNKEKQAPTEQRYNHKDRNYFVTKTILDVAQVCHKHGVIHQDLKLENFLYANATENAQLKAIGFCLSIFFEPGQRFGEIVGSPYNMAPEVLRRNYGQEIDVWGAGVKLLHLLCGVPPFLGSTETEEGIAHAIVKGTIDFNRYPWARVSDEAKDLVEGMLDANPHNRFTVEEVLGGPFPCIDAG